MTKEQAYNEAKKVFEEDARKSKEIIEKAKKEGKWLPGLDSNRHLFKELRAETKAKLELINSMIDEE